MFADIAFYLIYIIGLITTLQLFFSLFDLLIFKPINGSRLGRYKVDNAWAIVTGATDGIGKEFTLQLAKRGFNMILISRSQTKLEETVKEIEVYKVQTQIHVLDFLHASVADYDAVADMIDTVEGPITVLVNNVGMTHEFPEKYLETDPQVVRDLVSLNITTLNEMTRIVLPIFVEQKLGYMLNMSSASTWVPAPLLGTYSATKTYVNVFSKIIQQEYARDGIRVEILAPLWVETKLSKMRRSFFIPSAHEYVSYAMNTLGSRIGPHAGYLLHDLAQFFITLLPESMAMSQLRTLHQDIRVRALRKKKGKWIIKEPRLPVHSHHRNREDTPPCKMIL